MICPSVGLSVRLSVAFMDTVPKAWLGLHQRMLAELYNTCI